MIQMTADSVFIDSRAAADDINAALAKFAAEHGLSYDIETAEHIALDLLPGGLPELARQLILVCNITPQS